MDNKIFGVLLLVIILGIISLCVSMAIATSDLPFWVKYLLLK